MSWLVSRRLFDKTISTAAKIPKSLLRPVSSVPINEQTKLSTIDQSDVDLFSKQMKDWWNPDGALKLLHSFNTIRLPFIRDGLAQCTADQRQLYPLRDKTILDVGCGGGILSEGLARLGAKVTGIDASKELITVAIAHRDVDPKIADFKPNYHSVTIEEHAKEFPNHYDGIVASEVIEHVNNQELFVKSCVQVLKPGGRIFLTTPNRTRLSQCLLIYMAEDVFKLIPKGAHQYEKFITPNELTFILERNNCHVESTFGIQFNPITNRWSFSKSQHLMYAIQAQKLS